MTAPKLTEPGVVSPYPIRFEPYKTNPNNDQAVDEVFKFSADVNHESSAGMIWKPLMKLRRKATIKREKNSKPNPSEASSNQQPGLAFVNPLDTVRGPPEGVVQPSEFPLLDTGTLPMETFAADQTAVPASATDEDMNIDWVGGLPPPFKTEMDADSAKVGMGFYGQGLSNGRVSRPV